MSFARRTDSDCRLFSRLGAWNFSKNQSKKLNLSCLIIGLVVGIWVVLLIVRRLILIVPISTVETVGHFLEENKFSDFRIEFWRYSDSRQMWSVRKFDSELQSEMRRFEGIYNFISGILVGLGGGCAGAWITGFKAGCPRLWVFIGSHFSPRIAANKYVRAAKNKHTVKVVRNKYSERNLTSRK